MAAQLNYPLLFRFLGTICLLIGGSMSFSFPFAYPVMAQRTHLPAADDAARIVHAIGLDERARHDGDARLESARLVDACPGE